MNTTTLMCLCAMLSCPMIALTLPYAFVSRPIVAARLAGYCIGIGFLISMGLLFYFSLSTPPIIYWLISVDTLNLLLGSLVLLVSFIVHRFSLRYMHGDRLYRQFFILLSALTLTVLFMVLADNIFLFWSAWSVANGCLVLLMVHKKEWLASRNSGILTACTLTLGSICLLLALILFNITYATSSINTLTQLSNHNHLSLVFSLSMSLILVASLTQSGLFPFHRWLISSLNSPTPVSALMHAGLINGGGILLVKFAPMLMVQQTLLTVLFIVGSLSALLGTIWKLMQPDIKKMLACSTMAQMGFMMMQCGVGLFAAAIAHLCWHGLFKAYLFLNSGSAITHKKSASQASKVSPFLMLASLIGGIIAMSSFAFATNKSISWHEASAFVLFFAFIAGVQLTLTWLRNQKTIVSLLSAFLMAAFSGFMYGTSIHLIEYLIPSITTRPLLNLSAIHWSMMILFGALWVVFNFEIQKTIGESKIGCWLYMSLFNSSQPNKKTVTAVRTDYNY